MVFMDLGIFAFYWGITWTQQNADMLEMHCSVNFNICICLCNMLKMFIEHFQHPESPLHAPSFQFIILQTSLWPLLWPLSGPCSHRLALSFHTALKRMSSLHLSLIPAASAAGIWAKGKKDWGCQRQEGELEDWGRERARIPQTPEPGS